MSTYELVTEVMYCFAVGPPDTMRDVFPILSDLRNIGVQEKIVINSIASDALPVHTVAVKKIHDTIIIGGGDASTLTDEEVLSYCFTARDTIIAWHKQLKVQIAGVQNTPPPARMTEKASNSKAKENNSFVSSVLIAQAPGEPSLMASYLHAEEAHCVAELNRMGCIIEPDLIGKGVPLLVSFCSPKDGTVPYLPKTFDFGVEDVYRALKYLMTAENLEMSFTFFQEAINNGALPLLRLIYHPRNTSTRREINHTLKASESWKVGAPIVDGARFPSKDVIGGDAIRCFIFNYNVVALANVKGRLSNFDHSIPYLPLFSRFLSGMSEIVSATDRDLKKFVLYNKYAELFGSVIDAAITSDMRKYPSVARLRIAPTTFSLEEEDVVEVVPEKRVRVEVKTDEARTVLQLPTGDSKLYKSSDGKDQCCPICGRLMSTDGHVDKSRDGKKTMACPLKGLTRKFYFPAKYGTSDVASSNLKYLVLLRKD